MFITFQLCAKHCALWPLIICLVKICHLATTTTKTEPLHKDRQGVAHSEPYQESCNSQFHHLSCLSSHLLRHQASRKPVLVASDGLAGLACAAGMRKHQSPLRQALTRLQTPELSTSASPWQQSQTCQSHILQLSLGWETQPKPEASLLSVVLERNLARLGADAVTLGREMFNSSP